MSHVLEGRLTPKVRARANQSSSDAETNLTSGDFVEDAAKRADFTPRGTESASMSMSDHGEDVDLLALFDQIRDEVVSAREVVLRSPATGSDQQTTELNRV